METINTIELRDENVYPDETVLRSILGKSHYAYSLLIEMYDKYQMTYEWRYYRDGKAWLCKVHKKKRTIVWMSVWKGFIQATIYFPQKNIDKLYRLDITDKLMQKIKLTRDVGKSKPCIFEIRNRKIIKDFEKVMNLKIECK